MKISKLSSNFVLEKTKCGFSILSALPELPTTFHEKYNYPSTFRGPTKEILHGTVVEDPYRWLEDPDAPAVENWVERQVKCTNDYMAQHKSTVKKVNERMTKLFDYEKYGTPFRRGDRYFFFKNDGLQNQYVLYKANSLEDAMNGKASVLLDINTWREDGTASYKFVEFSEDGKYMAYGVSLSGSDWTTIYVRDVESCKDLPDKVEWVKFTNVSWTHDHKGFFYSRYPAPNLSDNKEDAAGSETTGNRDHMIYYHTITNQQDVLVYKTPEHPKWLLSASVSDCGETLLITASESCDPVNSLYYAKLSGNSFLGNIEVVKVVDNFEAEYAYLTNEGSMYYFRTNLNAPKNRIVCVDFADGNFNFQEVIEESEKDVMKSILVTTDASTRKPVFLVQYLCDCQHIVESRRMYADSNGAVGSRICTIDLPAPGSVGALRGRKQDSEFFYSFTSFLYPGTVFRGYHESNNGGTTSSVVFDTTVEGFDRSNFMTEQVFYSSKDGTKIPMFISRKRSATKSPQPTVLYGYGGFNISLTPSFSVTRLAYMNLFGGTFCVANLRGGGEYGKSWHEAGQKLNKQNVFDDFHAAAEYLVEKKYTTSKQLAIMGGSNGGLLVAACLIQRPELYGCAISQVPVADMLRFHKFTIGYAWCSDYGNADENKEEFEYMLKYSPVHNTAKLSGVEIPATMVLTADHDDRVVPLHSYKFISGLQRAVKNAKAPALIRIECKAGHGAGMPTEKVIKQYADVWSFCAANTGATLKDS
eukprot:g6313.t1